MSEPEHISHDEALEIIRRLGQAFRFVDEVVSTEGVNHQIWVIYGHAGQQSPPTIQRYSDMEALSALIIDLRARQNATADVHYWMHVFYGQRWPIQKGRVWQIWDGKQYVPIEGSTLPPVLDESGSLFERVDLDRVLADNPEVAPQEPEHEVHIRPQVIGEPGDDDEDIARPGQDPELM
jgi:hypothetical protein